MKKTLFLCIAAIASVFALNSCEDVPEPYKLPEGGGEPEVPVLNEITCAEALALFGELEDGETSSESYVITGYIVDVYSNISKNQQSFWISDTKGGEKMIQAYWANLPEGVEAFTVGSQVKITGKLLKYVNANTGAMVPEVKNANVEILGEGGGDEPVVPGTEVTCAKAAELCNALADGATSEETYTISGFITDVFATVSRNQQSFWMADTKDGGKVIQAYWANLPEGVAEFKVGSEVKITGKLLKYVNANTGQVVPEVKNATVEIISEGEGGDEPEQPGGDVPEGDNIFANGDFEQWENGAPIYWKSKSTAGNVTITQSTEAHSGTYAASMGYAASANKRMAYQETTLQAGTYKFSFYAKGTNTSADAKCQTRPGYVAILADGSADSKNYMYGDYAPLSATQWTLVEHEFTLDAETTICPVIMSPKNSSYHTAQNILIDDATLVKIK